MLGTAGVGKSWFGLYAVLCCLRPSAASYVSKVLYRSTLDDGSNTDIFYLLKRSPTENGQWQLLTGALVDVLPRGEAVDLYLHDSMAVPATVKYRLRCVISSPLVRSCVSHAWPFF